MEKFVKELLSAASCGPFDLKRWLDEHSDDLTPEVASQARDIFKQASESGEMDLAVAAALGASSIFLRIGRRYDSLTSYLDFYQVLFMKADDTKAYQEVRAGSKKILLRAEEIEANDLIFNAAVLAADSAFFASKIEKDSLKQDKWLLTALEDILIASGKAKHYTNSVWFQRYVSLLSFIAAEVNSKYWTKEKHEKIQKPLRQLASVTEILIPIEFDFPGDALKTNMVARYLADLSYYHGDPSVANERLSFAVQRAEEEGDVETLMETIFDQYVGAKHSNIPRAQLVELRQSLWKLAEEFRLQFRSRAGRLWAAQELDRIFGELLRDELKDEKVDISELFEVVEGTKARILLDQMDMGIQEFPSTELAARAAEMERQVLRFEPEGTQDPIIFDLKLVSKLSIGTSWDKIEHRQMLSPVEEFYSAHRAGFQKVVPIANLSQVMSALQPDEALVEFCIPYHRTHPAKELWAIVVTSQKVQVIPVSLEDLPEAGMIGSLIIDGKQPIDISPLGECIWKLQTGIRQQNSNDETINDLLESLWRKLIFPLLDWIKPDEFNRWIIVPHGVLHYVPFAALLNPSGTYLVEEVALTISPSASIWYDLQGRQVQPVKSFIGFSNPVLSYMDGLSPLSGTEKELEKINKILSSLEFEDYKREEATEARLRAQITGKNIVHLATHGDFPQENAIDFHRILLSATSEYDGPVTAEEIRRMNLQSARLIVLSICDGGLYRFGPGDEPYGLFPAFLSAGAENILGTLWPIEDDVVRFFIITFYEHLLQYGPAEALRRACKQFIQDRALVRHWAGFALVGPGRPFG